MKHIIKFIVLFLTWPFVLMLLVFIGLIWLIFSYWDDNIADEIGKDVRAVAYRLWHFKTKR